MILHVLIAMVADRNFKRCFSVPLPVAARRLEPQERQRVAGGGRRCRYLRQLQASDGVPVLIWR